MIKNILGNYMMLIIIKKMEIKILFNFKDHKGFIFFFIFIL